MDAGCSRPVRRMDSGDGDGGNGCICRLQVDAIGESTIAVFGRALRDLVCEGKDHSNVSDVVSSPTATQRWRFYYGIHSFS